MTEKTIQELISDLYDKATEPQRYLRRLGHYYNVKIYWFYPNYYSRKKIYIAAGKPSLYWLHDLDKKIKAL